MTTAAELASVVAAVGLAQNFGALRALAAEGIHRAVGVVEPEAIRRPREVRCLPVLEQGQEALREAYDWLKPTR